MSRASVLARGRAAAAAGMTDRCTIRRQTGVTEDDDGNVTPVYETLYADQACRIQVRGAWGSPQDIGEAAVVVQTLELQLPVAVTNVQVNDVAEITAATNDAALVGRVFRLRDVPAKSEATARRVMCNEVTG